MDRKLLSFFSLKPAVGNPALVLDGFSIACMDRLHVNRKSSLSDKVDVTGGASVERFLRGHVSFSRVGLPGNPGEIKKFSFHFF